MLYIKQGKHLTRIGTEVREDGSIKNGVGLHHSAINTLKAQEDLEGYIKGLPTKQAGTDNDDIPTGAAVNVMDFNSEWHPGVPVMAIFYVDGDDVVVTESGDGGIDDFLTVKTTFADLKAALATL